MINTELSHLLGNCCKNKKQWSSRVLWVCFPCVFPCVPACCHCPVARVLYPALSHPCCPHLDGDHPHESGNKTKFWQESVRVQVSVSSSPSLLLQCSPQYLEHYFTHMDICPLRGSCQSFKNYFMFLHHDRASYGSVFWGMHAMVT